MLAVVQRLRVLQIGSSGYDEPMPEGHLLHHYARRHRAGLVGARQITSPQGRFDAAAVIGQLERVQAYGKHLFHEWGGGAIVHVHLGKQGVFLDGPPPATPPRPQVRMRVVGPRLVSDLVAPMVCEILDSAARDRIIAGLGVDPLRPGADPAAALAVLGETRRPIGAALLDQSVIAGVGNALRADVLNLAGIHPAVAGTALHDEDLVRLWRTLVAVMERSADRGAIDHTVYRLERCSRCGTPVQQGKVGGRTTYVCPYHQPPP